MSIKRIGSCHPWGGKGWDPVPGSALEKELEEKKSSNPYTKIMKKTLFFVTILAIIACQPVGETTDGESGATWESKIHYDQEIHLNHVRQLTDGGDNAEAYFSFDGTMLTFQSNAEKWGNECDQIYAFNWDTDTIVENEPQLISNDLGRTTCAYFMPGDTTILMPVLSPEIPMPSCTRARRKWRLRLAYLFKFRYLRERPFRQHRRHLNLRSRLRCRGYCES